MNISLACRQKQAGFTLVELLVVISIIALLIAILLPALGRARESAMMVKNLSNERQIMVALTMYGNDNKNSLPYASGVDGEYWSQKLVSAQFITGSFFWGPFRTQMPFNVTNARYTGYSASNMGRGTMTIQNSGAGAPPYRIDDFKPRTLDGYGNSFIASVVNPNPHDILTLCESMDNTQFYNFGRDGYYAVGSGQNLITVNGNAAVTYLDGHGVITDSTLINWNAINMRTGTWDLPSIPRAAPWFDRRR